MAREALSLHLYGMLEDGETLPVARDPLHVTPNEDAFVSPMEGYPDMAGDVLRNRSVKKTMTLPCWLNEEAERRHANFSAVLQETLRERCGS